MHNLNTEENESGGGASGGGGWSSYVPMVLTAVGLSYLYWMIRDNRQKNNELQMKIMRNQLYIENSHTIDAGYIGASRFSFSSSPEEMKKKILDTLDINRGYLVILFKLHRLEDLLVERQHIFCSRFKPKSHRLQLEEKIRKKVSEFMPTEVSRFDEVFEKDVSCASCLTYLWTRDKRKNGGLMWDLLQDLRREFSQDFQNLKLKNLIEDLNEDPGRPSSSSGGS